MDKYPKQLFSSDQKVLFTADFHMVAILQKSKPYLVTDYFLRFNKKRLYQLAEYFVYLFQVKSRSDHLLYRFTILNPHSFSPIATLSQN